MEIYRKTRVHLVQCPQCRRAFNFEHGEAYAGMMYCSQICILDTIKGRRRQDEEDRELAD